MTGLLLTFWKPIAAIMAALLGALGLYAKGRADASAKAETKDLKAEVETRKRIDAADTVDNPSAAAEWLRERGERDDRL